MSSRDLITACSIPILQVCGRSATEDLNDRRVKSGRGLTRSRPHCTTGFLQSHTCCYGKRILGAISASQGLSIQRLEPPALLWETLRYFRVDRLQSQKENVLVSYPNKTIPCSAVDFSQACSKMTPTPTRSTMLSYCVSCTAITYTMHPWYGFRTTPSSYNPLQLIQPHSCSSSCLSLAPKFLHSSISHSNQRGMDYGS